MGSARQKAKPRWEAASKLGSERVSICPVDLASLQLGKESSRIHVGLREKAKEFAESVEMYQKSDTDLILYPPSERYASQGNT